MTILNMIDSPPNAAALMQSLRDIGYELDTALADLIDNSITASASLVDIVFDIKPETKVAIIDNGDGMSRDELIKAMTIGSKNPLIERDNKDLGRFGLGLKTASFSQCKRLTVITKQFDKIYGMCWDLNQVSKSNSWKLIQLSTDAIDTTYQVRRLKQIDTGTLVVWEQCDRLNDDHKLGSETHLLQKFEEAESHLRLIFHRFLDTSYRHADNLQIRINGRAIGFVDPFFRSSLATQFHNKESIRYKNTYISIQGYTLPHHSKCNQTEYEKYALGSYRDKQGFYVYRANRLLILGDWFRLTSKSDLTALTRIEIDLPNNFDSEWHIDIKKSHAKPPDQIRDQLKHYIDTYVSGSKRVYNSKGYRKKSVTNPVWHQYTNKGLKSYQVNKEHPLIQRLITELKPSQSSQLKDVIALIEKSFPVDQFYSEYAAAPKDFKTKLTDKEIEALAIDYLKNFADMNLDISLIKSFLETSEPYCNYQGDWQLFLNNKGH
ncbi:ATP-binding protein [Psychrobacter sp. Ps4]|uniref:ATP-binding protein n=1 Tax=Psychrobacter sp. Ps4 TaxID=2790958 RepID=UPI001EE0BEB2|nr:ATP-binding protein [Psychrobacter sp. Ps4]